MRGNRTVPLVRYAAYRFFDRLIRRCHSTCIGMDQCLAVADQCDVTFPEHKVVALVSIRCVLAKKFLQITVAGAGDAA